METRVEIIQNRVADIQHDMQISNDKLDACVSRSHKNTEDIQNIDTKIEDFAEKLKEVDERHSGEIDDLRQRINDLLERLRKIDARMNSVEHAPILGGPTATSLESL